MATQNPTKIYARYPVDRVVVSGGFGQTEGYGYPHKGVDLECDGATLFNPVMSGFKTVVQAYHEVDAQNKPKDGWGDGSFGNALVLDVVDTPWYVLFAHLRSCQVTVGSTVAYDQPLAVTGNTGSKTTGPHVHWQQSRDSGFPAVLELNVDPVSFIDLEAHASHPNTTDPLQLSLAEQLMLAFFSAYEDRGPGNRLPPLEERLKNARYRLKPLVQAQVNQQSLYSRLVSLDQFVRSPRS